MENKKKTPVSAAIFYIIGILLIIVSAFMLVQALAYTKVYLQSYEATFGDMWADMLQYIFAQTVPSCGLGAIAIGIGLCISNAANAKCDVTPILEELADMRESRDSKLEELQGEVKATVEDSRSKMVADLDAFKLKREAGEQRILTEIETLMGNQKNNAESLGEVAAKVAALEAFTESFKLEEQVDFEEENDEEPEDEFMEPYPLVPIKRRRRFIK